MSQVQFEKDPSRMDEARPPNRFAGIALDRCSERREDAAWLAAAWPRGRIVVVDFEGRAPCAGEPLRLSTLRGIDADPAHAAHASFLGIDADEAPWFALPALRLHDSERAQLAGDWQGLRETALRLSAFESGLFAYAKALLLWQTRAAYCGACGNPTVANRAGHSRRCGNADCALEQFPRTDVAIIVLVTDGDRALLGRQAGWPARGYSTLAGFVEPGESLEDALRREVREESGVRVGACRYHSTQPWPFPQSLMVGFRAIAEDPAITLGDELEDARWFAADALLDAVEAGEVRLSPPLSISFRLIADWLLERQDPERVRRVLPGA